MEVNYENQRKRHALQANEQDHPETPVASGEKEFELDNIGGQRYIGAGLNENVKITINGTPGNDLGAFMNGPKIIVNGEWTGRSCQHHERRRDYSPRQRADIIGYGMRGGSLYIKGDCRIPGVASI